MGWRECGELANGRNMQVASLGAQSCTSGGSLQQRQLVFVSKAGDCRRRQYGISVDVRLTRIARCPSRVTGDGSFCNKNKGKDGRQSVENQTGSVPRETKLLTTACAGGGRMTGDCGDGKCQLRR